MRDKDKEISMVLSRVSLGFVKIEKFLTTISWSVALAVTLMIVADVVLRFLFKHPLPASWEICELAMPWIVFMSFAYTLTIDGHVRVSMITDIVPANVRRVMLALSELVCLGMCAMITYWSWVHFRESFVIREEMMAAIALPWWVGKLAMPVGMFFFTMRYFFLFVAHVRGEETKSAETTGV